MQDTGAVGVFGSLVLVSIVVTAGVLAYVSIAPGDPGEEFVDVEAEFVPVNVSGTGERFDGHEFRVSGVYGVDVVEARLVHNGSVFSVELEGGDRVWLPCPSEQDPGTRVVAGGGVVAWSTNLPCRAGASSRAGGGGSGASVTGTGSEVDACGGDGLGETVCLVGGASG